LPSPEVAPENGLFFLVNSSQGQAGFSRRADLPSGRAERFGLEAIRAPVGVHCGHARRGQAGQMPPDLLRGKAEQIGEFHGRPGTHGERASHGQAFGIREDPQDLLRGRLGLSRGHDRGSLANAMDPTVVWLVPHTHWDREWYLPFEGFLARLVEMMDGLIELMDREPRFAHFHLDGQAAMIDDYLTVRPQRESDIRRLAGEGRLSVGPWFTQMDEFLVSGESLIRNLEWGLARSRQLGAQPPSAGYLPDQFGHVGQMPQILRAFGIGRAVVWRGVPSTIDRTAFWWEAPDGSRVLTEYLAFGYGLGLRLGQARDEDSLAEELRRTVDLLRPISPRDRLLVTVGSDHEGPAAKLPPMLEAAGHRAGVRARIGSIAEYLGDDEPGDLPSWRGELRSAARAHLLPGVYSTRIHQKQQRARVEALLERYAEPLAALVPGFTWPEEALKHAWRLLLWNGAHDSVCGCSVDEVARAVDERYAEAEAIAGEISHDALVALAARMSRPGWMYFNPSPFERFGVPGLGWRVEPDLPFHPPAKLRVVNDRVVAGDLRLRLVDEGDVGDLYSFCPTPEAPPREPATYRAVATASLSTDSPREADGDMVATFDDDLRVDLGGQQRPDGSELWVGVRIVNDRPDHRLRLHVALPERPDGSVAVSPFEVIRRPLASEGGTENPSPTWPTRGAVLAGGLGVFGEGVFEYEVIPDPPELAITLLRCVGTISRPQIATRAWSAGPDIGTPAAQMLGGHSVHLWFERGLRPEDLPSAWERYALALRAVPADGGGKLPGSGSLLEIEGAELSSVRRVDEELEVRIWNPSKEQRESVVGGRTISLGPARIETVRFSDEEQRRGLGEPGW
jgi:hypothetical protein